MNREEIRDKAAQRALLNKHFRRMRENMPVAVCGESLAGKREARGKLPVSPKKKPLGQRRGEERGASGKGFWLREGTDCIGQ